TKRYIGRCGQLANRIVAQKHPQRGVRLRPFIYFVQGALPDKMDIWRIRPAGGIPERITVHNSHVSHPVFLNQRTLLYLATTADGSRAAFYALDSERRIPHRVSFGLEQYTSLAASAGG